MSADGAPRQHYGAHVLGARDRGRLLRAAAVARGPGAAGDPAGPQHHHDGVDLGLHLVPAQRLDRHADRRPPRRHVRQGAHAPGSCSLVLAGGTLVSALAKSVELLILGRVIQGTGGAIFPLAFGIIRDEFPPAAWPAASASSPRARGGGGGGIVLAGPIIQHLSYHWLFWLPPRPPSRGGHALLRAGVANQAGRAGELAGGRAPVRVARRAAARCQSGRGVGLVSRRA